MIVYAILSLIFAVPMALLMVGGTIYIIGCHIRSNYRYKMYLKWEEEHPNALPFENPYERL